MNQDMLITDPNFHFLIQSVSEDYYNSLKEYYRYHYYSLPICVWNNIIIDGHKRLDISKEYNIPYKLQYLCFEERCDATLYICKEQLKRDDLTTEYYKYLLGKTFQCKCYIAERKSKTNQEFTYNKNDIAENVSHNFHISCGTVHKYTVYTKSIDTIRSKSPEFAYKVLHHIIRLSHENIMEICQLPSEDIKYLNKVVGEGKMDHMNYGDIWHELKWRKSLVSKKAPPEKNTQALINQMPQYDPDAAFLSLALTIPSWKDSVNRAIKQSEIDQISDQTLDKILTQISELNHSLYQVTLLVKEVQNERSKYNNNTGRFTEICTTSTLGIDTNQESSIESGLPTTAIPKACN